MVPARLCSVRLWKCQEFWTRLIEESWLYDKRYRMVNKVDGTYTSQNKVIYGGKSSRTNYKDNGFVFLTYHKDNVDFFLVHKSDRRVIHLSYFFGPLADAFTAVNALNGSLDVLAIL